MRSEISNFQQIEALYKSQIFIEGILLSNLSIGGWLPKHFVLRFFDYSESTLTRLEEEYDLEVSKIGHRTFYSLESIKRLLDANRVNG